MVQWLRLHTSTARGTGSIPVVGDLRSHMPCSIAKKKIINMFKTLKQTLMCLVYIHINFQGDYMNFDIDIKCFDSFSHFLFIFLGVI